MLKIILGQPVDIYEEFCACFIDWQKEFDCVNWTKLMQILKLLTGMKEDCIWIRVLNKDAVSHPFYSTYTASTLPRKLLKGLETSEQEDK
jgi:hypothetical protein